MSNEIPTSPAALDTTPAFVKLQRCFMALQLLDLENMTSLSVALERSRLATEWIKLLEEHQLAMAYRVNQVSLDLLGSIESLRETKVVPAGTGSITKTTPLAVDLNQLLAVLEMANSSRRLTRDLLAELAELTNRIEKHSVSVARINEDLERSATVYGA